MRENKQVHPRIASIEDRWIHLSLQLRVVFDLEAVDNSARAPSFDIAFLEDKRSVSLEPVGFSLLLTDDVINHDVKFLHWLELRTV